MLGEVTETVYTVEEDEDENEHVRVSPPLNIERGFELRRYTIDGQKAVRDVICARRLSRANCTQCAFVSDIWIVFEMNAM